MFTSGSIPVPDIDKTTSTVEIFQNDIANLVKILDEQSSESKENEANSGSLAETENTTIVSESLNNSLCVSVAEHEVIKNLVPENKSQDFQATDSTFELDSSCQIIEPKPSASTGFTLGRLSESSGILEDKSFKQRPNIKNMPRKKKQSNVGMQKKPDASFLPPISSVPSTTAEGVSNPKAKKSFTLGRLSSTGAGHTDNQKVTPQRDNQRRKEGNILSKRKGRFSNRALTRSMVKSLQSWDLPIMSGVDDSIVILPPVSSQTTREDLAMDGLSPVSSCSSIFSTATPKYGTPKKQGFRNVARSCSSVPSSGRIANETIDLVDDDDIDDNDDIIVIEEIGESDVSYCGNTPSKSRTAADKKKIEKETESTESEEIEIVGVRIVAPSTSKSPSPLVSSTTSWLKCTPSRKSQRRRSSLSYSSVKQAANRVRKRFSSSLAKTSVASKAIKKKPIKSKRKNPMKNRFLMNQNQSRGFNNNFRNVPQRRFPVPIYDTSNELGPANDQWRNPGNPNYIPLLPIPNQIYRNGHINNGQWSWNNLPRPTLIMPPSGPNAISVGIQNNVSGTKRPIIIDGSNVAMAHGNNRFFSSRGIQICVKFFLDRGHKDVTAFVPQYRAKHSESKDTHILDELQKEGILKYTPSREVGGLRITSYDDRFIVQSAVMNQGVIISNDNYRDLYKDEPDWRETIKYRILQFTWLNCTSLMFPKDPLGRNGISLDQFLLF